jgi:cellulose synthase/poly-beta-1,6-N-acetylglucosamine synthase-like glycosyltransferase
MRSTNRDEITGPDHTGIQCGCISNIPSGPRCPGVTTDCSCNVIVVDDGSTDDTANIIAANLATHRIDTLEDNAGAA